MTRSSGTLRFTATPQHGGVSAILDRSDTTRSLLVLGHGSGANMHVPFIAGLSHALLQAGVGTFRYEFPYSDRDDFVPYSDTPMDEPDVLLATVKAAVAAASGAAPDLPLLAGGHSVSGLMTSIADSESALPGVRGVVILGFPLKGDMARAAHFATSTSPILFLQGTNDSLGEASQMKTVTDGIGHAATLQLVESADHGFQVPGRSDDDVTEELARTIAEWTDARTWP